MNKQKGRMKQNLQTNDIISLIDFYRGKKYEEGNTMAKGTNQKLKLIYLMKILLEKTDEEHGLTREELIQELSLYDISAERKSIYSDLEALKLYGLDIISEQKNRTVYYYIGSREFEIAELKLLVDAVQSSKFITEKKSRQLIKKLESFASKSQAKELHRNVYVQGRIKTMNESIYYNVDKIHQAMGKNVQIKFHYFQWNVKKEPELRHNGDFYQISPWQLLWDNENYYLVGYDKQAGKMKHYRVDKMLRISLLELERECKEVFDEKGMAEYAKKRFGMYDGKEQTVKLRCKNELVGVMIDRFGKNIMLRPVDKEHFEVNVEVAVSGQFLGWIIALGEGVKIVGPDVVVEKMNQEIERLIAQYRS